MNKGFLEVGLNEKGEVVINHPDLEPDENGVGHIVFSPDEAKNLARLLLANANEAEAILRKTLEERQCVAAEAIPVDRTQRVLAYGRPVTPDHREINPATGMQKDYVVLTAEERAKGFVRPVRDAYRHNRCGKITTMGRSIAETYARDPQFYNGTMCVHCKNHFPIGPDGEFTWYENDGTEGPKVGT